MLLKAQNSITRVGNFSPKKNIFGGEYTRSLFICNVSLKPKLVYISKSGFSSEDRTPIQETQLPAIKQINKKNINNKNGLGEVLKITNVGFRLEFKLWLHSMPSA